MAKLDLPRVRLHQIGDNDPERQSQIATYLDQHLSQYMEPSTVPLSIKAGDRRTVTAVWRQKERTCELSYERHPAAGSRACPGEAVLGIGKIGSIEVRHSVFEGGEEFGAEVNGPDVLDPGDGPWFGMGAGGASLQMALNVLAMKIECVREWCDAVGKER